MNYSICTEVVGSKNEIGITAEKNSYLKNTPSSLKCTRFKTDLILKYFIYSTTFSKHIRTSKWLYAFHDLLLSTFPSLTWTDWLHTSICCRQWKRPCHQHLAPTQVMLPMTACYIYCVVTTIIHNPTQKQIQCKGLLQTVAEHMVTGPPLQARRGTEN